MANQFPSTIKSGNGQILDNANVALGGSTLILSNTSYSGADIKVVVHLYERSEATKSEREQLEGEIDRTRDILDFTNQTISELQTKSGNTKAGTPEFFNYTKQIGRLLNERERLSVVVHDLSRRLANLQEGLALESTKVLAEVQTLSISSHRAKRPVRALGKVYPKGYSRGSRTIAGSMIFTVFNEHVLYQFLEAHVSDFDGDAFTSVLLDQMPPVDISIVFANEYGASSHMTLIGVEFVDEGQVMSIEDLLTENTVSYVARDYDPMRSVAQRKLDENSILTSDFHGLRASDLLLEPEYQLDKGIQNPFERFNRRQNPYI